jgi:hypothetical protein
VPHVLTTGTTLFRPPRARTLRPAPHNPGTILNIVSPRAGGCPGCLWARICARAMPCHRGSNRSATDVMRDHTLSSSAVECWPSSRGVLPNGMSCEAFVAAARCGSSAWPSSLLMATPSPLQSAGVGKRGRAVESGGWVLCPRHFFARKAELHPHHHLEVRAFASSSRSHRSSLVSKRLRVRHASI